MTSTPSLSPQLSDAELADLRAELAAARKERAAQAKQLEAMQRQLEAAQRQASAPVAGPYQAPAWADEKHADELVAYLVKHNDQPRGPVLDVATDFAVLLGVRNVYFMVDAQHIAAAQLQWSDLSE